MARPFLKWAGGKRQLISEIEARLPADIDRCKTYVEPFVGGGAVLFHLLETRSFDEVHISDLNPELILCYRTLQNDASEVITHLTTLSETYPTNQEGQSELFYNIREEWNLNVGRIDELSSGDRSLRVAQMIFLNKTCFNGLFRVNQNGQFNVPPNYSAKPSFPSPKDLLDVQESLNGVTIHTCSFEECENWIDDHTFVYFDPPYRPLPDSSSFVSYTKGDFNDDNQRELASFFRRITSKKARALLSNSDPTNTDPEDNFFDELYDGFRIDRISANRAINSKGDLRGPIREILVSNY